MAKRAPSFRQQFVSPPGSPSYWKSNSVWQAHTHTHTLSHRREWRRAGLFSDNQRGRCMWGWMGSDRLGVERVRGPACAAVLTSEGLYETGTCRDLSPHSFGGGASWKEGLIKCLFPFLNPGNLPHPNFIFDVFDSLELTHVVSHVSELFIYLINKDKKKKRWIHLFLFFLQSNWKK